MIESNKFKLLFKKYRLRAEFATFAELGNALSEKGLIYEDSIFSHWQKGDRIPSRPTIIKLIEIFSQHQSIKTLEQANEFLESAGEGYLTEKETRKIEFTTMENVPFQLPHRIDNFTGREELIKGICKRVFGEIILIQGSPGVGKSALAIRLGYVLKDKFPDGVLWYRLDTSDVADILLSIAFSFGKDISHIQDKEIRAAMVRSILSGKKVLLIFDNAEIKNDISLLLPNNNQCGVVITSRFTTLSIASRYRCISLEIFSPKEMLQLFKTILGHEYVTNNKPRIISLAEVVGFLPLALHIFAKELKKGSVNITDLLEEIGEDKTSLRELAYGDKNLYLAINFSYELLDEKTKKLFLSLAIFNGKDFSLEAVGFINELSLPETRKILNNLQSVSLIEQSLKERFRIHPMIKKFIREKLDNPRLFLKAAKYYEQFLSKFDKNFLKSYPNIKQESDNVLYIFKKCYELHYWDEVIALWNPLETLLYATNQLNKMRYLFQIVKSQKEGINLFQKIMLMYLCALIVYWFWLNHPFLRGGFWNYLYSFLLTPIPVMGGIVGFFIAKSWGLLKSSIGRSILFLSAGLLSWGIGNIIWAYYNFFKGIAVPYPSWADIGFIISYPLWTIGMINLPHALGGKFILKKKYGKILILIPVLVFVLSYFLLVFITKSFAVFTPVTSYVKLFFDITYPSSDIVILTAALIVGISYKFFGEKYKLSIYTIILAFCSMYIADFLFSYTTTTNTYYNGDFVDLAFTISFSFLSFGVLGFYTPPEKN